MKVGIKCGGGIETMCVDIYTNRSGAPYLGWCGSGKERECIYVNDDDLDTPCTKNTHASISSRSEGRIRNNPGLKSDEKAAEIV